MRIPLAIALAITLSGCSKDTVVAPALTGADGAARAIATAPGVGAVLALQSVWEKRDLRAYEVLLTEDFQFVYATADSAGSLARQAPWTREDELAVARRLFVGDAQDPPARAISVALDRTLLALPDPRPGKDPRWHRMVSTSARVKVSIALPGETGPLSASGAERFYVVRGDSATFPRELVLAGVRPDSTKWWLERWEELGPLPGEPGLSWAELKARFR